MEEEFFEEVNNRLALSYRDRHKPNHCLVVSVDSPTMSVLNDLRRHTGLSRSRLVRQMIAYCVETGYVDTLSLFQE